MPFPGETNDPELMKLMTRAFEDACQQLDAAKVKSDCPDATHTMMALCIMTAVARGERDPRQLKLLALRAVDGI